MVIMGILALTIGMVEVTNAQGDPTTAETWTNPDSVIKPIITSPQERIFQSLAEPSTMTPWLSWLTFEQLTSPLTPKDSHKILISVEALLHSGQLTTASNLLDSFKKISLDRSQTAMLNLLSTKTLYLKEDYRGALQSLKQVRLEDLSVHNRATALWLQIGSLLGDQKLLEAIKLSQDFEENRDDLVTKTAYTMIWDTLCSMSAPEINRLEENVSDIYSRAWLSLTKLLTLEPSPYQDFRNQLIAWGKKNPKHAANIYLSPYLMHKKEPTYESEEKIALLLPLSSPFSEAAKAIRDGFLLMSKKNQQSEGISIRIYDFGEKTELIDAYYDAAIRDQADLVVGPVGTTAVKQLAKRRAFPVPTLLFGTVDSTIQPVTNAYQFSLAAEHDAANLARRGINDGHRQVIVLYPDTNQGHRIFDEWNQVWKESGGQLIQSQAYNPEISDHSQILRELFHLDQSEARRTALQRALGDQVNLKFIARRRQDIDAVFVLADINQTRLIKPQIDFHHGHDLVVYSLNSNYTGIPEPVKDLDIEGIVFGEMPWIVNQGGNVRAFRDQISTQQSRQGFVLDRLFALGIDAYGLIKRIGPMQQAVEMSYQGVTGTLSISKSGKIIRQLEWFQIANAKPVHLRLATLPMPPRLDLQLVTGG